MLKVWVVGSNGQIGTAINEVIEPLEIEVLNTDQDELDITNTDDVISFGEINRPDIIINCAAITDVYKCERNRDQAFRVNALGPRNLCIVADDPCHLCHFGHFGIFLAGMYLMHRR